MFFFLCGCMRLFTVWNECRPQFWPWCGRSATRAWFKRQHFSSQPGAPESKVARLDRIDPLLSFAQSKLRVIRPEAFRNSVKRGVASTKETLFPHYKSTTTKRKVLNENCLRWRYVRRRRSFPPKFAPARINAQDLSFGSCRSFLGDALDRGNFDVQKRELYKIANVKIA